MAKVLEDLRLDNLLLVNTTGLQALLTQISIAVRQNAMDIQAIQDSMAALQGAHTAKTQADSASSLQVKSEIQSIKDQYKNLVTGNDVNELRFALEQKHRLLEDNLAKARDSLSTVEEETQELRNEVIKHDGLITSNRKDFDKLKQDYVTTFSGFEYKMENLDHKFSTFVTVTNTFATKEEVNGKIRGEVLALKQDIEHANKHATEMSSQLNKKFTDVVEGDIAEIKQAMPGLNNSVQELIKDAANSSMDIKAVKVYIDTQAKSLKELTDVVDTKADKNALEEVAKYAVNTRSKQQQTHQLLQHSISTQQQQMREVLLSNNSRVNSEDFSSSGDLQATQDSLTTSSRPPSLPSSLLVSSAPPLPTAQSSTQLTVPTLQTSYSSTPLPLSSSSSSLPLQQPPSSSSSQIPPLPKHLSFPSVQSSQADLQNSNFSMLFIPPPAQEEEKGEEGKYLSMVSDTVDVPAPELMAREIKDTQKITVDMRKDLSDLASLVEVVTSEMKKIKDKDANSEVWQALDQHSQQLAHLLHTKADLSNVDHILTARDRPTNEDLESLKEKINAKANKDELRRMRRALQRELDKAMKENMALTMGDAAPEGAGALALRSHYRCLACDRLIWKVNSKNPHEKIAGDNRSFLPSPTYDMAPNIAWRRSQVKDIVSKHHAPTVSSLVNTMSSLNASLAPSSLPHTPSQPSNKSPKPRTPNALPLAPALPPISPSQTRTHSPLDRERDGGDDGSY